MEYTPLNKLYYSQSKNYDTIYQSRWNSPDAVHLDLNVGDYPMFFLRCPEVSELMYATFRRDKEIAHLCETLPDLALKQYTQKCLIDEIVLTNKIEGVNSSRREIGEVLSVLENQSRQKGKQLRFFGMVEKYDTLMNQPTFSMNESKEIRTIYNDLVLDEIAPADRPDGKLFRKDQVTVYSETGRAIHVAMTPESQIIDCMNKALVFLKDESIEYRYRICIFHFLLEYIHPFYDGNGRLGRFLLSYLVTKDFTPLLAFHISETIKENLKDYYRAFYLCGNWRGHGDLTPFLIMMLEMLKKSSEELLEALQQKQQDYAGFRSRIPEFPGAEQKIMSELYHLLIEATLFSDIGMTQRELAEQLKISLPTVRKKLAILQEHQLLEIHVSRKWNYYRLKEDSYAI